MSQSQKPYLIVNVTQTGSEESIHNTLSIICLKIYFFPSSPGKVIIEVIVIGRHNLCRDYALYSAFPNASIGKKIKGKNIIPNAYGKSLLNLIANSNITIKPMIIFTNGIK